MISTYYLEIADLICYFKDRSLELYFEVFEIFAFAHAWFRMRNAAERIALHLVYCLYNIC